jgi:guanyl-specific ribonuclease Sa
VGLDWKNDRERLIIDKNTGNVYYTPDHYETFVKLD